MAGFAVHENDKPTNDSEQKIFFFKGGPGGNFPPDRSQRVKEKPGIQSLPCLQPGKKSKAWLNLRREELDWLNSRLGKTG